MELFSSRAARSTDERAPRRRGVDRRGASPDHRPRREPFAHALWRRSPLRRPAGPGSRHQPPRRHVERRHGSHDRDGPLSGRRLGRRPGSQHDRRGSRRRARARAAPVAHGKARSKACSCQARSGRAAGSSHHGAATRERGRRARPSFWKEGRARAAHDGAPAGGCFARAQGRAPVRAAPRGRGAEERCPSGPARAQTRSRPLRSHRRAHLGLRRAADGLGQGAFGEQARSARHERV